MIPAMVPVFPATSTKIIDILRDLGLTTNLKLCLDAGDSDSYSGSGQTWSDRSGGGYDFYRGTTSGAEGSDPTFNGTAGRQTSNEYFSLDGGDQFILAQTNPSWVNSFHKTNAKLTIARWVYVNNITSTSQYFCQAGDVDGSVANGFLVGASTSVLRGHVLQITNASASIYGKSSTNAANNNAWNFLAVSADFSTGAVIFKTNDNTETYTSQSFSGTPISGSAGATLRIGTCGASSAGPDASGTRRPAELMWDTALTAAQLTSILSASRATFGI